MGSGGGTRNHNGRINSALLCQLSYPGLAELPQTLASKVRVAESGCWEWTAARQSSGYGSACVPGTGRSALAHRLFYELLVGPIPNGLQIDHLCMNKPCVNPAHLEAVTQSVNMRRYLASVGFVVAEDGGRMERRIQRQCRNGHPTTDVGSRINGQCVACRHDRLEAVKAERRERGLIRIRSSAPRPTEMQALVEAMFDVGTTQRETARAVGIHEMTLSRYLRGQSLMPREIRDAVHTHLGTYQPTERTA